MPPVELPVTRIEQQPGLCGAATAQMILNFLGLTGTSLADQTALWTEIKNNTAGALPGGTINPHDCPSFPKQFCTQCGGAGNFTCWCTYPDALLATLSAHGLTVGLTSTLLDGEAATRLLQSVDWNLPAAALVKNGLHWLVVAGYLPGTGLATDRQIDGKWISEIYIRNPTVGAANQSVSIVTWLEEYQAPSIVCGPYENRIVVIAGTALRTGPIVGPGDPPDVGDREPTRKPDRGRGRHRTKPNRPRNPHAPRLARRKRKR